MKVAAPQVGGVLRDPGRFAGLLFHGDDAGLVRQRALSAARAVAPLDDAFRACVLTKEEHSRLLEEARSLSLVQGRRVVRVVDAGDALAGIVTRLDAATSCALVVLESGALNARSKLRQAAEKSPAWASVACYPESGAALAADIRQILATRGFSITDDAVALLSRALAADTATRRSELEKLALFASGAKEIGLDLARQCCAPTADASLDLLAGAAMAGDVAGTAGLLIQVADDGATGAGMIVALTGRAQRLLKVRLDMQTGRSAEEAVRSLMPPVFFRDVAAMVREARLWSEGALLALMAEARSADIACKRAGSRDGAVASQLYLTAAHQAARLRKGP